MSLTPPRKTDANLSLARNLLKAGLADSLILKATSLSAYQLHQLRRETQTSPPEPSSALATFTR